MEAVHGQNAGASREFVWNEKYRPTKVVDCILPDRLKKTFQKFVETGEIPNLILSGGPGAGKTTVAIAMCEEIGLSYLFINSSDDRGIDTLRTKVKNYASTLSIKSARKVVILDEADGITADAQKALRGCIEEFSGHCTFIFTCNFKAKLIDALHSRCAVVDFQLRPEERPMMATLLLKRIEHILKEESVPFERPVLIKLIERYFPDYRRTLNELQRYSQEDGAINAGTLAQVSTIKKFPDLVAHLKSKDFSSMRKWVAMNVDVDATAILRAVYDDLYQSMIPEDIPQAVVLIAKYQYQSAFVADQEINLVACLTEIMATCVFK